MYDVVVIGLGGVGSFALRALSKGLGQGKKILGLERFHRVHEFGSSHGESRIYRRAYFEDAGYIPWIDYSILEFEMLGKESGFELLNKCGNLILQDKPSEKDKARNRPNYLQLAMDAAKEHDIEVEFLEQEQLKKRFPQFHYPDSGPELIGLLEPDAGFVRPEMAMEAALQQAEAEEGVEIWERSKVVSLKEAAGTEESIPSMEVEVERDGKVEVVTIASKTVLIAAGAWASQLIPSWSKHLTVTRQVQGWVDVSSSENSDMYESDHLPTWILVTSNYRLPFFGIPVVTSDGANGKNTKVGVHNDVDKIDGDPAENPATISEAELSEYQRAVKVALNSQAWNHQDENLAQQVRVKTCMYTMTEDENFLIGVPEEFKNVFAVAGLSGHGFKMAPALGQLLADFALTGEEELEKKWKSHRFCHPSRFDKKS